MEEGSPSGRVRPATTHADKHHRMPSVHTPCLTTQVMPALEGEAEGEEGQPLPELLTGKFVLYVHEDEDSNPRLALRVELAPGAAPSSTLAGRVAAAVRTGLLKRSSEYAAYVPAGRQLPLVTLHQAGDPEWFPVGVKHRYTLAT